MLTLTAYNTNKQNYSTSMTGIADAIDMEMFFSKSQCRQGEIHYGDLLVGTWSEESGYTWLEPTDPFGNAVGPVVSLERTATEPASSEKVDYTAMTDKQLREYIAGKLQTSNEWLRRAVVAIFNRQTSDEQVSGETKHNNGRGFNGLDSGIMTNIANRIIANRRSLSEKELAACRKIMPKYVGQLVIVVRETRG